MSDTNTQHTVRDTVREGYAKIAQSGHLTSVNLPQAGGCCGAPAPSEQDEACCGGSWSAQELATEIGYAAEDIAALPEGANMGLSCGNPVAIANLKPGQVVVDLGSGGGFDVFLAGPKVGPTGRAIGVDMTPEMLAKARSNVVAYQQQTGLDNVEFRLGEIEHLPLADRSVDVVISNCVINLSPDKPQVWSEIARVLKPGGIVAASDMALLRPLPEAVREMMEALVGCVAGAVMLDEYTQMLRDAGLVDIDVRPKPEYVEALSRFKDPMYAKINEHLPAGMQIADYVTSVDAQAHKPAATA